MSAIVFARGDGTGDDKTFKLEDITIPEEYIHDTKPQRVIPRAKTGIVWEGFFPLFSVTPNKQKIMMYTAALNELGLDENNTLGKLGQLGLSGEWFERLIENMDDYSKLEFIPRPEIYSTTYTRFIDDERVGDPHSIYYNKDTKDALQVGGFLAVTNSRHPFLDCLEKLNTETRYRKIHSLMDF